MADETYKISAERQVQSDATASRRVTAQAQRALEEAKERRLAVEASIAAMPPERGGRGGAEPVRYGDWEVKGLATDF